MIHSCYQGSMTDIWRVVSKIKHFQLVLYHFILRFIMGQEKVPKIFLSEVLPCSLLAGFMQAHSSKNKHGHKSVKAIYK